MISVMMHSGVAERSRSRLSRLAVPHLAGLTVADIVSREGFPSEEAALLLVMINNQHARLEDRLQDGDMVDLILPIAGGGGFRDTID